MTTGDLKVTIYPLLANGRQLADAGEYDQAAQTLIAHLRQHPDEPQGLALLGRVAMRLGALGQAEQFLRRALAKGATELDTRRDLATVLSQQERLEPALALTKALADETADPPVVGLLANLHERLGRNSEALAIHAGLAAAGTATPATWVSYGHALRAAGQVDDAIAAYRRAIALDEEFGDAWWGLASIKRKVLDDDDLVAMQRALGIAVDARNIAPLRFALGRTFHDRGDYEEAFAHYDEANRIRAESIGYDARELTDEVTEVERLVDVDFVARLERPPLGEARPIFIVSLPRSGSTLLEQMLGSHPQIEAVGELPYIPAILRAVMEMATRRGKVTVPQLVAGLTDAQAEAMGRDYLQRAQLHRKTDRPWFIDKLPHNWSNVLFIKRIVPQARFVHIQRPAMDCCFSNFTLSFTRAHGSSFALSDVGQCYVDHVRMMRHLDAAAPGLVHHLDYAALVDDPQRELAATLTYLGLSWDESVLAFHKLDRVVRTPSSEQVRRPINRDGIEVWKPYSRWLAPLRDVLGDLAET